MELTQGIKAVVVGLGKSGLAAVRYLHEQGADVKVSEWRDANAIDAQALKVLDQCQATIETGGHTESFFADAELVVVSPGVPHDLPILRTVRERAVPVVGELALAAGQIEVPVIAVTGSNGKTTVTGLIGHLLQSAGKKVFVGGNIGTPLLEYLRCPAGIDVVVLELSSFQLQTGNTFRPDIGLLLNISADHLDWHGSMEAYIAAKKRIFVHQRSTDTAIIGCDDAVAGKITPGASLCTFGTDETCRAQIGSTFVWIKPGFASQESRERYELGGTALHSRVNLYNAAAAILATRSYGLSQEEICAGLTSFQPPEHRMTPVAEIEAVSFINDSKATNTGAVAAALSGFEQTVVLIAGGRDKKSDFSLLESAVSSHVHHVVLLGEAAGQLEQALAHVVSTEHATDMDDAVNRAYSAARPGDTVLLAPACASFDMFSDYRERGRVFSQCVRTLKDRIEGN